MGQLIAAIPALFGAGAGAGAAAAGTAAAGTAAAGAGAAAAGSGLASTLGTISAGLSIAQVGLGLIGSRQEVQATQQVGVQQARQLEGEARQAEAISQQEALKRRREGALLASRQRAIAAAQGGGADPSTLRLLGQTAVETERAALTELYRGTTEAEGLRARGRVALQQASVNAKAATLGGVGRALGQTASALERFGDRVTTPQQTGQPTYRYG